MSRRYHIATSSILTPEQAKEIEPVNPAPLRHCVDTNHDDDIHYVNAVLELLKLEECNEPNWFPTPQEPGDENQHAPKQKRVLQEVTALQKLEKLNTKDNKQSFIQFLPGFHLTDSTLDQEACWAIGELLIEFHDIFTRQRFDHGINEDVNVKLSRVNGSPAHNQNLPTPINPKEYITWNQTLYTNLTSVMCKSHFPRKKTER